MGKTEIIEALARLSPQDLAEVRARLDQLARDKSAAAAGQHPSSSAPGSARIRTPHLAKPSQAPDFIKQVISAHA
jgi:hypothetical protein